MKRVKSVPSMSTQGPNQIYSLSQRQEVIAEAERGEGGEKGKG